MAEKVDCVSISSSLMSVKHILTFLVHGFIYPDIISGGRNRRFAKLLDNCYCFDLFCLLLLWLI